MSAKSLKLRRMPVARRLAVHEAAMRDQVLPVLRETARLMGLMEDRIAALELEVATLKMRDDTAQRLAAVGLVPAIGQA